MKKLIFIAVIFLTSCTKEETPKPNEFKVAQTVAPLPTNTIDITGFWYDYNHISGSGYLVPVKFQFVGTKYLYSEYNATLGWRQLVSNIYDRIGNELTMSYNYNNYTFFGTILNDSTIQMTQYSGVDTLPSYLIHKEQ